MLRIPNPGSDLDIFIRIYRDLYRVLAANVAFDLDDMSKAMIASGNVSSQGAFGQEALRRSTRDDRSRDPLYNQSKMYAELFRTLGWIQSTTDTLRFTFSWLGEHVAEADNPRPLVLECLLGVAYPTDALGVRGEHAIRPFAAILRTMSDMDGDITRDEMIVGPLSMADDRSPSTWAEMISLLRTCRAKPKSLLAALNRLSKARNITHVTMTNYTRFPIAAVQWAGWARKSSRSTLTLTDEGRTTIARLRSLNDVRLSDYRELSEPARAPFCRVSAYSMLDRSGFDISPVKPAFDADILTLKRLKVALHRLPLFSPFQQIAAPEVNAAFPQLAKTSVVPSRPARANTAAGSPGRYRASATIRFRLSSPQSRRDTTAATLTKELLGDIAAAKGDLGRAVALFATRHQSDNQGTFYPLIAGLFNIIGYECRAARRGVNYDRADAMIVHASDSIPIEIKSPGEEREISVKAIRQAVENKVVLLSRQQFATRPVTTTLAIGFNAPNERSEVAELIDNVHKAFGFNVGVLDLHTLAGLAMRAVESGKQLTLDGFTEMKGIADVEDLLSS